MNLDLTKASPNSHCLVEASWAIVPSIFYLTQPPSSPVPRPVHGRLSNLRLVHPLIPSPQAMMSLTAFLPPPPSPIRSLRASCDIVPSPHVTDTPSSAA